MATLIGTALLVVAVFQLYRAWHRLLAGDHTRNPVLDRLTRSPELDLDRLDLDRLDLDRLRRDLRADRDLDRPPEDATPDSEAETDEAALTRQLIAGTIDPATYQERMSELAHSSTQPGGMR